MATSPTPTTEAASPSSAPSRQEVEAILARLSVEITRDRWHVYSTPVGELRSVTTVLKQLNKEALVPWASKIQSEADEAAVVEWFGSESLDRTVLLARLKAVRQAHKKLTKKAADAGTEGHKLAECEFRKQLGLPVTKPEIEHPEQAYAVLAGIMEWAKGCDFQPVAMEPMVYSKRFRYAGAGDLVGYKRGRLTLVDFKSNNGGKIYRESYLQNHGLRGAYLEHGLEMDGEVVVVPRDGLGDVNPVPIPWDDQTFIAFRALVHVDKWAQSIA